MKSNDYERGEIMNLNTDLMDAYAQFLEDHSREIINLCGQLEECLNIAVQCMDQQSGLAAAARMARNIENVRKNVPMSDDACKRLVLARRQVDSATQVFGR